MTRIAQDTSVLSTHRVSGGPPRQPLYLMSRRPVSVCRRDASLVAYERKVCVGRYPLTRMSRVIATAHVNWHGNAIAACLEQGIGIAFVAGAGTFLGSCIPSLERVSPLTELLEELIDNPRWSATYDNFLRHLRADALRHWAGNRERALRPVTVSEYTAWVRSFVHFGEPPVELAFDCRGFLRALIDAHLYSRRVRVRYWRESVSVLDLGADITSLVYGTIVMEAGALLRSTSRPAAAIRLFENASPDYLMRIEGVLGSLERLLLRSVRQWQ
ncbi:MAG: CRISPR-associated endonuclease Cas1 [Gammaproteobacteria bacterium]|nr:CRISPR-associated endonuclease Cas1 [Gammaproteobacteria bacterium]